MASNISIRYNNAANTLDYNTTNTNTTNDMNQFIYSTQQHSTTPSTSANTTSTSLNNSSIVNNNYDLNNLNQRKRMLMQMPMYIKPKVCKSPVVIHSVRSKHVTKPTAQSAVAPLQPPPPPPSSSAGYNFNQSFVPSPLPPQQQQQNTFSPNNTTSYTFRDMNQALPKALPQQHHQMSPNPYHFTQQYYNLNNSNQYSNGNHTALSNSCVSDIENVTLSTQSNYEYNTNLDISEAKIKDISLNSAPPLTQYKPQLSNTSVNSDRKYPPPPYPGRTTQTTEQTYSNVPTTPTITNATRNHSTSINIRTCSPQAFKFFMEQHIENIFKQRKARDYRRVQLENEMSKAGLPDELQEQMRKLLCQKETNYIRLKRAKMNIKMFDVIKLLGTGAFGEVNLVKKFDTGRLYAMKTLHKSDVFNRNQAAHVKAERDILAEADNEWVVKLYYSFQDEQNLYFVMDYIPGGDLMNLLIKLQIFEENLAKFYIAELVCAIESVHNLGFIHRGKLSVIILLMID